MIWRNTKTHVKHLWRKVMVIKHELLAKKLEHRRNEEHSIRRIVRMDDVETFAKKRNPG